ncbi:MAG: hypothetical protein A3J08_03640 [Candidatus Lloydbacteria bacterium RIFCSPLOWO2_02_FULL_51_11]|nr:MAG: hypothetical protein A3J08_03640 [Candidatus Lloydbacteria bacterium RIFCSPLOWO2_02_FULL_51_11]
MHNFLLTVSATLENARIFVSTFFVLASRIYCQKILLFIHNHEVPMKSVAELKHVQRMLPNGGKVVILNTGALIGPEAEAMLQALHSRSVDGIDAHLAVLAKRGPENFMETFYVGYGHKSIGDCGTITVFIEGVSMLVAKAIQDWALYSGQEVSTRYVDFAKQSFCDPCGTAPSRAILEAWRSFYVHGFDAVLQGLPQRFPRQDNEEEKVYRKALRAYAFDIMRSFLPAGAMTNLAWHTNLRQSTDNLARLRHHPLPEVRAVACMIEDAACEAFPSSFKKKRYEDTERYNEEWMREHYYFTASSPHDFVCANDTIDRAQIAPSRSMLAGRPPKTELPSHLKEWGTLQYRFLLDFGSFRDIQRHRAVTQRMPLVTAAHGFHPWYLRELPEQVADDARALIARQESAIAALGASPEIEQYYYAMGYRLPNQLTGTLPSLVYLVELRATRFVHPTLRHRARQIAADLMGRFEGYGLVLHLDTEPNRFDARRGEHDIVKKE